MGSLDPRAGSFEFLAKAGDMRVERPAGARPEPPDGACELLALHRPVTPMRAVRVEFVAKLRFFDLLSIPELDQLLNDQLAVCHATRAMWSQRLTGITTTDEDPFMQIVYEFRLRQAQFIIDWLEACRERLLESASA